MSGIKCVGAFGMAQAEVSGIKCVEFSPNAKPLVSNNPVALLEIFIQCRGSLAQSHVAGTGPIVSNSDN